MDPKEQVISNVRLWLTLHKSEVQLARSPDSLMGQVRLFAYGASQLSNDELKQVISAWCVDNLVFGPMMGPIDVKQASDEDIKQSAKKGVQTQSDTPTVSHSGGKLQVKLTGLTAELKKGKYGMAAGVSWFGTASMEVSVGGLKLSGELSTTRWEVKLTYPDDPVTPDLSKLEKTVREAEKSLWGAMNSLSGFSSLNDIPRVKTKMQPYVQPLKDAVEAIQGAAKTPPTGINFGLSINSPNIVAGQSGIPSGYEVQGVVTIRF